MNAITSDFDVLIRHLNPFSEFKPVTSSVAPLPYEVTRSCDTLDWDCLDDEDSDEVMDGM